MATDEFKEVRRAYNRAYAAAHREERRTRDAANRIAHPDKRRLESLAYRTKYREEVFARNKAWAAANRESLRARSEAFRADHPDKAKAQSRAYFVAHREERCARSRSYKAAHPGAGKEHRLRNKEAIAQREAAWRRANPAAICAKSAKRRATQHKAMPAWANPAAIRAVYQEAAKRTRDTGIPHDVDHIYPLHSEVVCGLHVECNLQILTKAENLRKHNKLPSCQGWVAGPNQ